MDILQDTYLTEILHSIAQGLLGPTMVVIIVLVLAALFFVGQVLVEYVTERRHFKQNMPEIINEINDAAYDEVTSLLEKSKLLKFQKAGLVTVSRNMGLPEESLFALAQVQVNRIMKHYRNRMAWTDTMAKVGPMLGLMATLIPLGPGIVALGQGDVAELSSSLLVAFDATVCGLVCACVALTISRVRQVWYEDYSTAVESLMTCLLEKADFARKNGVSLPANYAGDPLQEYENMLKAQKKQGKIDDEK